MDYISELEKMLPPGRVRAGEPMKEHCTFKIGGPADALVLIQTIDEAKTVMRFCQSHKIALFVLGMGSNILVSDRGYRGIVIKLGDHFKQVTVDNHMVHAQAAIRMSDLARKAAAAGLSGIEFAEGIPGSLGGAIVMNAGAYGGEVGQAVVAVETLDLQGNHRVFRQDELVFSYRQSIFQEREYIILAATLELRPDEPAAIRERMQGYARQRKQNQPIGQPSAGSVFKRPPGQHVGYMIEQMGLKGLQVGGAEISTKHAGFIINKNDASCRDVRLLMASIQEQVKKAYGIELAPEVIFLGEDEADG